MNVEIVYNLRWAIAQVNNKIGLQLKARLNKLTFYNCHASWKSAVNKLILFGQSKGYWKEFKLLV